MVEFFRGCAEIQRRAEEVEDFLLRRYNSIDYVMKLDANRFFKLYKAAMQSEKREKWYMQWLVQLPLMTSDTYVSFEDYIGKITGQNIDKRSNEEIIAEIEQMHGVKIEV